MGSDFLLCMFLDLDYTLFLKDLAIAEIYGTLSLSVIVLDCFGCWVYTYLGKSMLAFSNNNSSRTLSNKASLIFLLSISTLILLTTYHILKTGRLHWLLEDGHVFASTGTTTTTHQLARQLSATELLERPLATNFTAVPRLIHQSWMNDELPAKFQKWSDGCRSAHPDWEWVLWTDEDNLALVRRYAPWFLGTYQSLEKEIYRADAVRNIYMHVFGG